MFDNKIICVAAAIINDSQGRMLVVRKRNTAYFMQPGGKIEPQESAEAALVRELKEELALTVSVDDLILVGQFEDIAANEPDHIVRAHIFKVTQLFNAVTPAAEIEEAHWLSPMESNNIILAPLTNNHVLPLAFPTVEVPSS